MENTKPNNIDDEIVNYVSDLYRAGEQELSGYKKRLNDFYKQYHSRPGKKYSKYAKANVFVPETFRAVETLVSDIHQMIFAEDPFFILKGREAIDEQNQIKVTALTDTQLEDIGFKRRMLPIIRYILTYGTVVLRYKWDYEIREQIVSKVNKISGNYNREDLVEPVVVKDTPDFELVDLLDITIDPSSANVQEADWIIVRKRLSFAGLKEREKTDYIENVSELENLKNRSKKDSIDELKNERLETLGFSPIEKQKKDFIVLEYFGKGLKQHINPELLDTDEGKEETEVHYIVCEKVVLRKKENVYHNKQKPFCSCSLFEDGDFSSENICSVSESSQQELNTTHSQMLDHRTFTLFHMWLKGKHSGAKRSDFKIELNKVVECEDINQVRELIPNPGAMATAVNAETIIRDDIRNATGATGMQQGIRTGGSITATEANALFSQGSTRVRAMAVSISEQLLKPLLKAFYNLNKQYMDSVVNLAGRDNLVKSNITLEPSELNASYDFIPKVMTDATNAVTIRGDLLKMLETSAKLADVVPPQSIYKLMRKIYENFKFKDVDEVFPLPEIPPEIPPEVLAGGLPGGNQGVGPGSAGVAPAVAGGAPPVIPDETAGMGNI